MYQEYGLCQIRSEIKYAGQGLMQIPIDNFIRSRSRVLKAKHADGYTNLHITCSVYSFYTNNAYEDIVTDFINTLPGNSYVNRVQRATIDEAVFCMSSAPSNSRNGVLCDQFLGYATVLTTELCFLCGPCRGYITRVPE
jgi:hypothetical protein